MKQGILLVLLFLFNICFGQGADEKKRLLDPRNYANGMTFVDDTELQIRSSDLTNFNILDTSAYIVMYRHKRPFLPKRDKAGDGELMVLEIGPKTTSFYSHDLYEIDSLYTHLVGMKTPRRISANSTPYIVYKNNLTNTFEIVNRIPFHAEEAIEVKDVRIPDWQIDTMTCSILGYKCLRAESQYNGRKWIVWFTPEIPLSTGPWKLAGLPGLILKADDSCGDYSFICIGLEKATRPIRKYHWHYIPMEQNAWLKFEKRMYIAPFSIFGGNTLIISGEKKGRLDEKWSIPYNPIEFE